MGDNAFQYFNLSRYSCFLLCTHSIECFCILIYFSVFISNFDKPSEITIYIVWTYFYLSGSNCFTSVSTVYFLRLLIESFTYVNVVMLKCLSLCSLIVNIHTYLQMITVVGPKLKLLIVIIVRDRLYLLPAARLEYTQSCPLEHERHLSVWQLL